MELCGASMSEGGGPLCQVEQMACNGVSLPDQCNGLYRPQKNGQPPRSLHTSTHQPRASHVVAPAPSKLQTSIRGARDREASGPGRGAALAGTSPGKVLVTGGRGYFGFTLGSELASRGFSVILLDMQGPPSDLPEGAVYYQNDIRDYASLYKVCEGVDCIFHTASYGMSGPDQLKKELIESVNVGGTKNIINVCKERGIPRLVYTSTINVVFSGNPIEDGDEDSTPCVPLDMHIDHYSRTKSIAEQLVRYANGSTIEGGGLLRSCVLRPCGIYGPGERRHLHRVMMNVKRRLFSFSFGDVRAKMNWVHVDNLVLSHILAAEALTHSKNCVASGQAYFINDGTSVNLFDWLTPLFEKLGYRRPLIHLPVSLVYLAAIALEYLHVALKPVVEIPLLFTRNEVRNIAVSHTFKIDKARRELGFCPKQYNLVDCVELYLKMQQPCPDRSTLRISRLPPLPKALVLLLMLGLSFMLLLLLCFHL